MALSLMDLFGITGLLGTHSGFVEISSVPRWHTSHACVCFGSGPMKGTTDFLLAFQILAATLA